MKKPKRPKIDYCRIGAGYDFVELGDYYSESKFKSRYKHISVSMVLMMTIYFRVLGFGIANEFWPIVLTVALLSIITIDFFWAVISTCMIIYKNGNFYSKSVEEQEAAIKEVLSINRAINEANIKRDHYLFAKGNNILKNFDLDTMEYN